LTRAARHASHRAFERRDLGGLDADVWRAISAVLDAYEGGETLPESGCSASVLPVHGLSALMLETAPPGDVVQLEAALWLGERLREQVPNAIAGSAAPPPPRTSRSDCARMPTLRPRR